MNRPGGVTVIAVLEFLGGAICALIGGLALLGGGLLATLMNQSGGQGSAAGAGIVGALGAALGIVVLFFAALYFVTGWGMLQLKGWARIITMVLAGLSILGSFWRLQFNPFLLFWVAVRVAIAGWILWYLLQPQVSAAFNGGQAKAASA